MHIEFDQTCGNGYCWEKVCTKEPKIEAKHGIKWKN